MEIETLQKIHFQSGDVAIFKLPDETNYAEIERATAWLKREFEWKGVVVVVTSQEIDLRRLPAAELKKLLEGGQ